MSIAKGALPLVLLLFSACGGARATTSTNSNGVIASSPQEPPVDESGDEALLAPEAIEALGAALRAYGEGDHQTAAILLQRIIDDSPADQIRHGARFFLAKSHFHLGYRWAALQSFYAIAQEPDHPFRVSCLAWFSLLARLLPDDRNVVESIDGYEPSDIDAGVAQGSEDVRFHLRFLLGRSAYRAGSYEEALGLFDQVPERSRWRLEARFHGALTHVRMRHVRPTLVALHDILRATGGAPPETPERTRRLVELTWMSVGRIHYSAAGYHRGALERSLAAYGHVPPGSEYVPRALFEQAWVLFRLERYSDAEAALDALPERVRERNPEVAYLRLVIGFCRNDAAIGDAATAFVSTWEAIPAQVEGWLEQQEEDEIYEAFEALNGGGDLQAPEPVRELLATAMESRRVRRHLDVLESIEREIERLDAAPESFNMEMAWATMLQDLVLMRSLERFNLGRVLRNRLRYQANETRTLVAHTLEIQLQLETERERSSDESEGE